MVALRMPPEVVTAIQAAAEADAEHPSRSELIRRIVIAWLRERGHLQGAPEPASAKPKRRSRHTETGD